MAHDNCDSCGEDYDFSKDKDFLVIYINWPEANHVHACCPHCGELTRIYLVPEGVMQVAEMHLPLRMAVDPPEDVLEAAQRLWEGAFEEDELWPFRRRENSGLPRNDEPQVPREWLVQLTDDLRSMSRMVGRFCHICGQPECDVHGRPTADS